MITITGTVVRSEKRTGLRGEAVVITQVQSPIGWPVEFSYRCGTSAEEHAAADDEVRARPAGKRLRVECGGLIPRTDHGHAVLVATGALSVADA